MAVLAVEVKSITMATAIEDGRLVRDYRVTYRIRADEFTREPIAIVTSGHPLLPNVFSTYAFFGSVDAWARFVRWESISPAWERAPWSLGSRSHILDAAAARFDETCSHRMTRYQSRRSGLLAFRTRQWQKTSGKTARRSPIQVKSRALLT
ncbi:MAG: hypothetical protein KatS3mg038_3223 [Candidatus Kapaibacterium sp.]|nr:MAG: hypothetical protein KatS3mg038_3223 [Candidatus Kapabacteria bacterium]